MHRGLFVDAFARSTWKLRDNRAFTFQINVKDLTDNENMKATNLTNQVRGIADVVTAVAKGDLTRKLTVDAKGEIAALAETINFMIETLSTFGDQVTNMAREVGVEGRLGGQARVVIPSEVARRVRQEAERALGAYAE